MPGRQRQRLKVLHCSWQTCFWVGSNGECGVWGSMIWLAVGILSCTHTHTHTQHVGLASPEGDPASVDLCGLRGKCAFSFTMNTSFHSKKQSQLTRAVHSWQDNCRIWWFCPDACWVDTCPIRFDLMTRVCISLLKVVHHWSIWARATVPFVPLCWLPGWKKASSPTSCTLLDWMR